jgi:small subunit ribosomal protein S7
MPRRRVVAKREILPDPKFGNVKLAKFMNHVMVSGKKSVAERIIYGALEIVNTRLNKDPIEAFDAALDNIAPMVEVKSRRVGGATYQVPVEVRPSHGPGNALAGGLLPRSRREIDGSAARR